MRNWLDKYETAGQVMVTSQTTRSPKSGRCRNGYGCSGNSSSQTGFGMDMGLGDPQKSGTAFDNWREFNTPVGWNELLTYNSTDLTGKDLKQYNKDITARTKSLQGQFPGLTEEQLRVAGGDSSRIRQRMGDLPRYDQPSEQTFDKAYHQFYRPLMDQKTPVTVEQILNYQSQQPGGLGGFKTTVTGNYGRKKAQYGGGLLSRKVTCSDCGWSWKGVEGGKDPMTCHHCGGMIKMQNGGDISIPDLEAGNWLDRYEVAGQVTNNTTRPPYSFASYQMPRQTNDSNSGLDRRKEVVLKTTANNVNETNTAVANFRKNNAWAANLSNNEIVNRIAMQNNSMKNQGTIKKARPKQSVASKTWEAVSHPMTAIKYAVNNQRIPDNFSKGETNILDNAVNVLNPATYINAGVALGKDLMPGPSIEMSNSKDHKPALLNTFAKAGINAFTNLVGDGNVYDDGSNERTLNFLGNAMTVLPIGAELKPFLSKSFSTVNNAIKTRPFLNRMIYGAPDEAGMITARSSVGPELNWDRQALAAQRAKAKKNTSLFGEPLDNSKLSQREFQKVFEGPSGMQHDIGYSNYPSSRDYDFQRTFGMRGKDEKGYLKFDLWKEKGNDYPELGDFSFFNDNPVSASDHIKMMMGNLPKKVHMPAAGDERLFSMYSQPIINANVSRLAGTPGRITVKPTGKSSVLNTGYLEGTGDENFLLQASKQFPRLQKSYKSLSDYTGVKFPEPKMYVDNKLVTAENLLSPELQQRMLDSKFSYTKPDVFRIEVPDYSIHKNFKQGGWLDNYANGGGFLMPFAQGGMVDPILKYPDGGPYTVKSGDTLWKIAKQYGMTPQQIAEANSIQNINDIKVNQVLNIPTLNAPVEPATPAVQPVVDADFVGPQPVVTAPQPHESVIQAPTNVRRVQAPVTQDRVVNTRHETPQVLNVQTPKTLSQAPASAIVGEAPPLFKTAEDREAWRQRLKGIANKALEQGNDEQYLVSLDGVVNEQGNPMTYASGKNCIMGICGLNKAAGMTYNAATNSGSYTGNQTFYDNVNNKKEDYYRVNGNFQIGDHIQLTHNRGYNPYHSMEIFDNNDVDEDGNRIFRVIHNGGGTQFTEKRYTEQQLKDLINNGEAIINRPGYSLDKETLKKEREAATSPEAKAALEKKKQLVEYQTGHDPNYQYSIREDSPMFKDQPEGMKQFIKYANNVDNINKLVEKLAVDKDVIHDELLNVFGELGAENKWKNPWVGGDIAPSLVGKTLAKFIPSIPLESTIERVGSLFNLGKGQSVGPGQIKMEMLDDEAEKAKEKGVKSLKELFGIKKMSDLQDYEKVIPLMTALNIRNRQWMERKGTDLSKYLIAQPGAGLHDLKYGPGRWTPYMYRGSLRVPTTNEETKTLAHGSYADEVFHNIDENLQRTLPYKLDDGQYRGMQPVIIQAKTKKKKKELGGQNNNWLNQYL